MLHSTALNDSGETAASVHLNKFCPTDIDNQPIKWDSNPATVDGVLHEVGLFFQRNGLFEPLLEQGVVSLPNGKIAVDSPDSIPFFTGHIKEENAFNFSKPCPPTPARVKAYDEYATACSLDSFATLKTAAPASTDFIVNKYAIRKED